MTNNSSSVFSNSKGLKILLVEDNPDDETLTLEVFKNYSMLSDVTVARDGQEALNHLFSEERPDLVIMDLKIPKITGIEVIKKIRAHSQTQLTPIVVFSSSCEERDLMEGYAAGANSYIVKPIDYKKFSLALHQILTYWLQLNELPLKHQGSFYGSK